MKLMFMVLSSLMLLIGMLSCSSGTTFSRATGMAYEIVVVMEQDLWNGPAGLAVKEELASPLPYLLDPEESMRITYASPSQFNSILRYVRNILIVTVDKSRYTKVSLHRENDKWAKDQVVVSLTAPDGKMIEDYLSENSRGLVDFFTKIEMQRAVKYLKKSYSTLVRDKCQEKFGIDVYAPEDFSQCKDRDSIDCLWFSNNATRGLTNLLVYSFPYVDDSTFTLNYLVAKRDSFAKMMVPGSHEGSYMSTEKRVVDYYPSAFRGKYCGILRGWWRMEGDMMGGPFVSYARVDEKNQRVVVTEGFVYEPQREKKNYIRRIEAALQTVLLPDEIGHVEVGEVSVNNE